MTCGDEGCTHDYCDQSEIKTVAQAMVDNGMQKLGYNYINLDDCWASTRSSNGTLLWDSDRFPDGLPALISWLHERNFKFGLYTSAGNLTCSSGGRPHSIPGSREHYEMDAATFAAWKVDYVKFDWCGDIKTQVWNGARAHKDFAAAMLKAGRPMFLEVVAGYFFLLDGIANYSNSWRFCLDHKDQWTGEYSTAAQIFCRVDQKLGAPVGSPGGWAHMDFLHTGGKGCASKAHCPGQTDDEYRTAFALWSLLQSPLIVDVDVRVMTPIMNETIMNKELIDIHQSTVTPPGTKLGTWLCNDLPGACQVWGRRLDSVTNESDWLIALVNFGNKTHDISVKWQTLGWDPSTAVQVRDLWQHMALPAAVGQVTARVQSHGTQVLRLTANHVAYV